MVESICRCGQRRRWSVLIAPRDPQGRMRLPKVWDGDGVIAALRNRNAVRHVRNLGLPVVDVSAALSKEHWFARVTTDDRARAELALHHLLQRGLKHFACYAPSIGRYSDARANEFRSLVESSGFRCAMYTQSAEVTGWLNNYTRVREWLSDLPRPLGVFAGDPYPARQLMEICDLDNISVPDEIAILLFTSGTTGIPKAAVLRHKHLVSYILGSVECGAADEDEAAEEADSPEEGDDEEDEDEDEQEDEELEEA